MQSAAGRPGRDGTASARTTPFPEKLGDTSPIKHCHLHHQGEPHLRSGLRRHEGGQRRSEPVPLSARRSRPTITSWPASSCCWTTSTVDGEVSADGHEWSMGAYATDFVEKVWPLIYRGSPTRRRSAIRPKGSFDPIARPAGGYLWDRCAEAKVSYRSYGEWIDNGKKLERSGQAACQGAGRPFRSQVPRLGPRLSRSETGRSLHRGTEGLRGRRRDAALHHPAPAQRSHRRHEGRQADADGHTSPTTTWRWAGSSRRSARASSGRTRPSSSWRTTPRTAPTTSTPTARWPWSSARTRSADMSIRRCTRRAACCGRWS